MGLPVLIFGEWKYHFRAGRRTKSDRRENSRTSTRLRPPKVHRKVLGDDERGRSVPIALIKTSGWVWKSDYPYIKLDISRSCRTPLRPSSGGYQPPNSVKKQGHARVKRTVSTVFPDMLFFSVICKIYFDAFSSKPISTIQLAITLTVLNSFLVVF